MCGPNGKCNGHHPKPAQRKAIAPKTKTTTTATTTKSQAPGFLDAIFSGAGTDSALSGLAGLKVIFNTETDDDGKSKITADIGMPDAEPAWGAFEYIAKIGEIPSTVPGGVFGGRTVGSMATGLVTLGALGCTDLKSCEDTATTFAKSCASTFWSDVDYVSKTVSSLSPWAMAGTAAAAAAIVGGTYAFSKWNTRKATTSISAGTTDKIGKKEKIENSPSQHAKARKEDDRPTEDDDSVSIIETRNDDLSLSPITTILDTSDTNTKKTHTHGPSCGDECQSTAASVVSKLGKDVSRTIDAAARAVPALA